MRRTCPHCGHSFRFPLRPLIEGREVEICPRCRQPLEADPGSDVDPVTGPLAAASSSGTAVEPTPPPGSQPPPPQPPPPSPGRPTVALPLGDRARVANLLLGAVLVAAAVSVWTDADQLNLVNRVLDGERVPFRELQESDDRVGTTAIVYLIATILSVITFSLWYSRAYRNTIALGVPDPRYGTRWAVAYWFIPIVNLFRPKQVMNDIWRGSDPKLPRVARGWQSVAVPPLIHWWWALWLLSGFVGTYATRVAFRSGLNPTAEELRTEATAYVVADICDVVAAIAAILVVRAMTKRQEARRAALEGGELAPDPGPPPVWECASCGMTFPRPETAKGHVALVHPDEFDDEADGIRRRSIGELAEPKSAQDT